MRRRDFLAGTAVSTTALPLVSRAQQAAMPVVGFLHYASPTTLAHLAAAVRGGMKVSGYIEGQNVAIEYRWAEGHYEQLPALAADLVRRQVTVITAGGAVAAQAAKNATATIPVVFTSGADPIASGLVQSLSQPGGNLTGVSLLAAQMSTKRLELIRDLLPHVRAVGMIINPTFPGAEAEIAEVEAAGRTIGMKTYGVKANSPSGIDAALASFDQLHVDAFMVGADGFFITRRDQLAALARRYAIPGIYPFPDFPKAGGLLSYGVSLADAYHQAESSRADLQGAKQLSCRDAADQVRVRAQYQDCQGARPRYTVPNQPRRRGDRVGGLAIICDATGIVAVSLVDLHLQHRPRARSTQIAGKPASTSALKGHCDNGPASVLSAKRRAGRVESRASGLASFTSRTNLPVSSTMQTLVS